MSKEQLFELVQYYGHVAALHAVASEAARKESQKKQPRNLQKAIERAHEAAVERMEALQAVKEAIGIEEEAA